MYREPISTYNLNAIGFSVLFYEFFSVLDWEISRFWGAPISWSTILFFVNRYGTLLGNIPIVFEKFWTTPGTSDKIRICRKLVYYHQFLVVIIQIVVGAMLTLRTYALYERSRFVLGLLLIFGLCVISIGMWGTISSGRVMDRGAELSIDIGCSYEITHAQSTGLIIAWAAMGMFDCMIFSLTLCRALSQRQLTGLHLFTVLLRDGSIYFGVMVLSNLSNILTFVLGGPFTRGVATTFTNVISSVMISRLMLNIRDPALSTTSNRFLEDSRDVEGEGVFSTYMTGEVELISSPSV